MAGALQLSMLLSHALSLYDAHSDVVAIQNYVTFFRCYCARQTWQATLQSM